MVCARLRPSLIQSLADALRSASGAGQNLSGQMALLLVRPCRAFRVLPGQAPGKSFELWPDFGIKAALVDQLIVHVDSVKASVGSFWNGQERFMMALFNNFAAIKYEDAIYVFDRR